VTIVPFPAPPADAPASGEIITAAAGRYLDSIKTKTTRSSYAGTLARLVSRAGGRDTASLLPEDYAAVMDRWDDAAAATWNRHLSALTSFTAWAGRQDILTANPARRLDRRKPARRSDRAIPRARLDKLLTDDRHGLRERVLWRMLYQTARAGELLSLNIEDLDLEFRRGRVTSKGGAIEYVHWATGTARLLPRLLRGRTAPELQAKSRHLHLGSLGRYVQLGEQTSAQVTADTDPAARRRTR
jgi:site-specific recombinase XerC